MAGFSRSGATSVIAGLAVSLIAVVGVLFERPRENTLEAATELISRSLRTG